MKWDNHGLHLADVPSAGISRVDPNARSGNPRHDARSGKFGAGGGKGRRTPAPANVDPIEYARMLDAVRDAAREFDQFDEGDVREFIQGRANSPDQVDIQNFLTMVQEQRKNDIVDLLDQAFRSAGPLRQGRRKVRISAPRGFLRKEVRALDGAVVEEMTARLEARGHDREEVVRFFSGRVKFADQAIKKIDTKTGDK